MTADPVEYLTVDAFRARYGIGTTLTYEMVADGRLRAVKLGRRLLIDAASARELFAALPAPALTTGLRRAARRAAA